MILIKLAINRFIDRALGERTILSLAQLSRPSVHSHVSSRMWDRSRRLGWRKDDGLGGWADPARQGNNGGAAGVEPPAGPCADWCSMWACERRECTGCDFCIHPPSCASWCNALTCSDIECHPCDECAPPPSPPMPPSRPPLQPPGQPPRVPPPSPPTPPLPPPPPSQPPPSPVPCPPPSPGSPPPSPPPPWPPVPPQLPYPWPPPPPPVMLRPTTNAAVMPLLVVGVAFAGCMALRARDRRIQRVQGHGMTLERRPKAGPRTLHRGVRTRLRQTSDAQHQSQQTELLSPVAAASEASLGGPRPSRRHTKWPSRGRKRLKGARAVLTEDQHDGVDEEGVLGHHAACDRASSCDHHGCIPARPASTGQAECSDTASDASRRADARQPSLHGEDTALEVDAVSGDFGSNCVHAASKAVDDAKGHAAVCAASPSAAPMPSMPLRVHEHEHESRVNLNLDEGADDKQYEAGRVGDRLGLDLDREPTVLSKVLRGMSVSDMTLDNTEMGMRVGLSSNGANKLSLRTPGGGLD